MSNEHLNYFKTNASISNRFGKYFLSLKEGYSLFIKKIRPLFSAEEADDYKKNLNVWHDQILRCAWSGWNIKYDFKMLLFLITFDIKLLRKYVVCIILKRIE